MAQQKNTLGFTIRKLDIAPDEAKLITATKLKEVESGDEGNVKSAQTAPSRIDIIPKIADTPQSLTSLERRQAFFALRKAGASLTQIAKKFSVDESFVHSEIQTVMEEYQTVLAEDVKDLRVLENMRLDSALLAIWPDVVAGDVASVMTMIKIMERRSKLLGLDATDSNSLPEFLTKPTEMESDALRVLANDSDAIDKIRTVLTRIGIAQKPPGV